MTVSSAIEREPDAQQATILYDRDCGFCRWSLARVLDLDRGRRLYPLALQERAAHALVPDQDEQTMFASAHLVTPEGDVYSGGEAVAPTLRLLPGGRALSGVAGALSPLSRAGYRWVARHRSLLGRPLTAGMVARATARIDSRATARIDSRATARIDSRATARTDSRATARTEAEPAGR